MRSSTTSGGTATAPRPARGIGMSPSTATTGADHCPASRPSSPPWVMATTLAPALAASEADSTVSSVSPENETANTSVCSSTKFGRP